MEPNYTEDEVALISNDYVEGMSIQDLADKYNKQPRSLISKLVHLKIYVPPVKEKCITNKMLYRELEEITDIQFESSSLHKKQDIEKLLEWIRSRT